MRLFSIALAEFGLVALYSGVSQGDALTLGFGGASRLAAALLVSPLHSRHSERAVRGGDDNVRPDQPR